MFMYTIRSVRIGSMRESIAMNTTSMDSTGRPSGSRISEIIGSVRRPEAPAVAVPARSEPTTIRSIAGSESAASYIWATKHAARAKYIMFPKRRIVTPRGNTRSTVFSLSPRFLRAVTEEGREAKLFLVAKQIMIGSITFFKTVKGFFIPDLIHIMIVHTSIAARPTA